MSDSTENELKSSINQSANLKLLTREELADYLMVSTRTVAKLGQEGLPENKIGGQYRYSVSKLEEWLLEHKYENNAAPLIFSNFSVSYDNDGKLYSLRNIHDIADILRYNPKTMYRLLESGDIPAFLVGIQSRFDIILFKRWLTGKQKTD